MRLWYLRSLGPDSHTTDDATSDGANHDADRQVLADCGLDDPEFMAFVLPLLEAVAPPIRSVLAHSSASLVAVYRRPMPDSD